MNAQNVIDKLGNGILREAARKLKIGPMTVCQWRKRDRIPEWRHEHIKKVARELGVQL